MANNTANLYTKEEVDSSFASKSHSHSNYVSANSLMTTVFTGAFTNRNYFTCYIPGPAQFNDWESLVRLLERQYTSRSTSLGCWGLFTNSSSGQNYSIIGLYFNDGAIVFDCQGPTNIVPIPHPTQSGNLLPGYYSMGILRTDRAYKISWLQSHKAIPTSY